MMSLIIFLLSCFVLLKGEDSSETCVDQKVDKDFSDCDCNLDTSKLSDYYQSRFEHKDNSSMCDRIHPVVWYDYENSIVSEYTNENNHLTSEQLSFYNENGYLKIKNLFSKEEIKNYVDIFENNLTQWYIDNSQDNVIYESNDTSIDNIKSIFNAHKHPDVRNLITNEKLLGYARQILNSDVYISQSRINFQKKFNGVGFRWHTDFETWHCEDGITIPRMFSLVIPLHDCKEYNGCLMVFPKSHKKYISAYGNTPPQNWLSSLQYHYVGQPSPTQLDCAYETGGITYVTAEIGDIFIFDTLLIHGSHNNISPLDRYSFFVVFNSVENYPNDKAYCSPDQYRPEQLCVRDPEWMNPL